MDKEKEFSVVGLLAKFCNAWTEKGGTKALLNTLAEKGDLLEHTIKKLQDPDSGENLTLPFFTEFYEAGGSKDDLNKLLENKDSMQALVGLARGKVKITVLKFLEALRQERVPGLSTKFTGEVFEVGGSDDDDEVLKISSITETFQEWFFNTNIPTHDPYDLSVEKLLLDSTDEIIFGEILDQEKKLGSDVVYRLMQKRAVTLDAIYRLMRSHEKSQEKALTNQGQNIFYINDMTGELRAVVLERFGRAWHLSADITRSAFGRPAGSRIFYCAS